MGGECEESSIPESSSSLSSDELRSSKNDGVVESVKLEYDAALGIASTIEYGGGGCSESITKLEWCGLMQHEHVSVFCWQ